MQINGQDFIIIGENVHTTRVVRRSGKLVTNNPDGIESVRYLGTNKKRRYLVIPESIKKSQEYEEGRVKHVIIAVQAAMSGEEPHASEGVEYIRKIVQRQVDSGTDFLDVNVDEISWRLEEQKAAMRWLVQAIQQQMSDTPLSIDSSNSEIIAAGLEVYDSSVGRALLNSASLERLDALDLVTQYDTKVMVTAASESGMPQTPKERVDNASRMVDAANDKGIATEDIFIDPLFFPIGVDTENGNHAFEAIRQLREKYGPAIHISSGFSNVSCQMPSRRLINDVFMILAVDAGADSGIIDPVTNNPQKALAVDQTSKAYQLTEDMLLGKDRFCRTFLRAYRKGELEG